MPNTTDDQHTLKRPPSSARDEAAVLVKLTAELQRRQADRANG
jgi:hypothetical protein